jgi:catechol 2,3-dioxygenase-like lactoylglutathione lyase family enzyme
MRGLVRTAPKEIATMPATATATDVSFHVGLYVANLDRSIRFYRVLFGVEPARTHDDYARFELTAPPLVLALSPSPQLPGGALNHAGLRLPDAAALVEVQRRLEEAGIQTERQEGVECCYARQTKFWVTDPDGNLWELYVFEEDIDHPGGDRPPVAAPPSPGAPAAAVVWGHRLTEPVPERIPHADASVDEVRLEGTFNARLAESRVDALLAEARRVLRPGGMVRVHGLVADRPFPGLPRLPGPAAVVERIPDEKEPQAALERAGFIGLFVEELGNIHCFGLAGVELREMRLTGRRPMDRQPETFGTVIYKGAFEQITDDEGTRYPRGQRVTVTRHAWELLRQGPAAEQFVFFPSESARL